MSECLAEKGDDKCSTPSSHEKEITENLEGLQSEPPPAVADRELTAAELARCPVRPGETFPWKGLHWRVKHVTLRSVVLEPVAAVPQRLSKKERKALRKEGKLRR